MSTKRIEKLTPEQEAQLSVYRERWTDIGLRTLGDRLTRHKLTRTELESMVADVYRAGGFEPPEIVVPVGSLMGCMVAAAQMSNGGKPPEKIDWHHPAWGCYDAGWLAWTAYMDEQLHVPKADLAAPLRKLAEHVGFFVPFKAVCFVSAPHVVLHRDDQGQLHNEDGPAISYLDGFAVYAIHGHRVPGWVIEEPEKITVEKVQAEENAETRRIMVERFPGGPGAYLSAIGAEVVHTDQVPTDRLDPQSPHLMRALMRTGEGDLFLVGTDGSTQRTYYMPLPSDQAIKTCAQAHEAISPFSIRDNKILSQT